MLKNLIILGFVFWINGNLYFFKINYGQFLNHKFFLNSHSGLCRSQTFLEKYLKLIKFYIVLERKNILNLLQKLKHKTRKNFFFFLYK